MTLTMADLIRYIHDLFAKETPTLLSWPICLSIDLMLIITTSKKTNPRTLSRPNTDAPGRLGGNGLERNRRQLQLLRGDSCVIKVLAIHAKYADVFEKQTTKLLSWRIYISIDFMFTTPLTSRTTGRPKRHLKKKKMAIRGLFVKQTPKVNCYRGSYIRKRIYYAIVDMEDIRYTIRKGRYIRTNKPLNVLVRLRLSFSVSLMD